MGAGSEAAVDGEIFSSALNCSLLSSFVAGGVALKSKRKHCIKSHFAACLASSLAFCYLDAQVTWILVQLLFLF